ncbi:hypothetical protein D9758_004714 [Tetrapyrgos nigripes]|uniref:Copper transport protein n=1 Tax=Tetrapyrgos nigripes TaxID=182062 RepID=A0A8H5LYT3_9AGAR|nr:hypothetical protein D9758_004714 [Tetrapyrgos nigripes]
MNDFVLWPSIAISYKQHEIKLSTASPPLSWIMSHSHSDSGMSGMDMSGSSDNSTTSSSSSSMMMMMMMPYLHFTKGDILLFDTVAPSSPGAIFATCLIMFLLSILDRYAHAARRGLERQLALRANQLIVNYPTTFPEDFSATGKASVTLPAAESNPCCTPPQSRFILSHDLSRGVMTGFEITLHYLLMLVVMTFNASYIISIILGAVVGEIAFGRLHRGY